MAESTTERINRLKDMHDVADRTRLRSIVDGGLEGLKALLGPHARQLGKDLPAPNLILSGMTRLGQKVGRAPTLKVDPPRGRKSDTARDFADKIYRIVDGYDRAQRLELQMHFQGRWLPGYGFCVWTGMPRDGLPVMEKRNPFNCFPGYFTADHPCEELVATRELPAAAVKQIWPQAAVEVKPKQTLVINELHTQEGIWIHLEETGQTLDFLENPIDEPFFVVGGRPTFGTLQGQYGQTIGMMANLARLNILTMITVEDDAQSPTDIIGEIESGQYRRGRFAVNILTPGSQVTRGRQVNIQPALVAVDRLERQLRLSAGYPVQDDAISPNSFVTGRGLEELGSTTSLEIREYQTVLRWAMEDMDRKRLKFDEKVNGRKERGVKGEDPDKNYVERYVPARDIDGYYTTRRVFGPMAGIDEPTKIINGIQLLSGGVWDVETFQENLDGFDDIALVRNRLRGDQSERVVFETLMAQAQQGNPVAMRMANEIRKKPEKFSAIIDEFIDGLAPPPQPEALPGAAGGAEDVTTVLSRLTNAGETAGVQTVGTL